MNTRIRRLQLPGGAFHITARTQGREHWFLPDIRSKIVDIITGEINCTDADLFAFAVMPNHFHLIVLQQSLTLGRIMQPVLRRVALLVQRRHRVEGHVFERRYFSGLLHTSDHLREAIVYTHRNPVKARLCGTVDEYEWTSHAAFVQRECPWTDCIDVDTALRVFAETVECDVIACRISYLRWVARRSLEIPDPNDVQLCAGGDAFFAGKFATAHDSTYPDPDLRDAARKALNYISKDFELEDLRGSFLSHRASRVRGQIVAVLLIGNHRTGKIANFFGISPGTVSKIAHEVKWGRAAMLRSR